ncbi:107-domain-containing protein [Absidia repens]|uniref:Nuclear pore complex protein n=1 Tax=Absidia repens TaxID=90262 RepID=A0A1X2I8Q6_9FUNG|nr:107-domain-containing protein [Absidia repens]
MQGKTIFERCNYDLDQTFTEILDRGPSQLLPEQTIAGMLADIVSYRLDHIKNSSIASKESGQKEMAFLHGERATWSLLDTIQRSSTPLHKCSNIKDWISNMTDDIRLPDSLKQDPMEDEIDAEIHAMFTFPIATPTRSSNTSPMITRKRGIHLDDDNTDDDDDDHFHHAQEANQLYDGFVADAAQRRRTTQDEEIRQEKIDESLYNSLRKGDLDDAVRISVENDEPWRITLIKSYVQRCKKIQLGEHLELDPDEQRSWRLSCKGLLKKKGLGPYGKAVYAILLGDVDNVLPVCQTWEDAIWACYNSRMELVIDNIANTTTIIADVTKLNKENENIANRKDNNLPRKHPGHFFHLVQTHILKQDLTHLYQLAYENKKDGAYFKAFIIRDDADIRHQMDRFMAAFVVYARQYLRSSSSDKNSEQIIYHYAKRNQYPPTFYPKTLAFYTSKLGDELEAKLFSEFLNDFDGDKEERKLLVEMGSQYNLNIKSILLRTFYLGLQHTSKKNLKDHPIHYDKSGAEQFELEGQTPDDVSAFLQALEWLLADESLYGQAIKETNGMIRKYLGIRKVYLAEMMVEAIPLNAVNHCVLQTQGGFKLPGYLEEFQDHTSLLECWRLFASWNTLYGAKPDTTTDELATLKRTLAWKNEILESTEKLEIRLRTLLTSSWLKGGIGSEARPNDALRKLYIPEAVIRLHHIQYSTKDIDTSPYTKKKDTLISLIASEKNGIYRDIVDCGKIAFVFKKLNEQ